MIKRIGFGEKTKFEQNTDVFSLKNKGEKVTVRFLDAPFYDAKHFMKTPEGWQVTECPRIMSEEFCENCDKFFHAAKELKKLKAQESSDKKLIKNLEEEKRLYKNTISFYYPVMKRDTEQFALFKTSLMVRIAVDEEFNNGIVVTENDYIVTRTEKPGSYYSLTRLPEKDVKPFTEKEQKAYDEYLKMPEGHIESMLGRNSKKSDDESWADVPPPEEE